MGDAEEDAEELAPEPRHEARERTCLMCGRIFESAWAGHRICDTCRSGSRWRGGGNSLDS